jgi:hypothetical protein
VEAIQASKHPIFETFYWITELRDRRYCLNNPHVCVGCVTAHNRKDLRVEHSPHVVDLAQRYTSPKTGKPVMVIASGRLSAFFPSTLLLKEIQFKGAVHRGKSLAAALMWGAQGVWMGMSRFFFYLCVIAKSSYQARGCSLRQRQVPLMVIKRLPLRLRSTLLSGQRYSLYVPTDNVWQIADENTCAFSGEASSSHSKPLHR